jgi:hypothetical protein
MKHTKTLLTSAMSGMVAFGLMGAGQAAHAQVTPPDVPGNIEVPSGNTAFLVGHATGTQNYVCLPSGHGFGHVTWTLFTPEATLFDDQGSQVITHFFSPNPFEVNTNPAVVANGTIRATWQDSDTSTVWGKVIASASHASDPDFVAEGAIAWLLVQVVGAQDGPTGNMLSDTTFIQRVNISGGVAPSTDCALPTDIGHEAFVPYTADYFFYSADDAN